VFFLQELDTFLCVIERGTQCGHSLGIRLSEEGEFAGMGFIEGADDAGVMVT